MLSNALSLSQALTYFRMIKKNPVELLCILFDIYSESPPEREHSYNSPKKSISEANNDWFVKNKEKLNPIFFLPLSSRTEELTMTAVVEEAMMDISDKAKIKYVFYAYMGISVSFDCSYESLL